MMTLKINGEVREVAAEELTVSGLLAELGIAAAGIAVELNGEIVPRSRHAETELCEGDVLEIVRMVGGGKD